MSKYREFIENKYAETGPDKVLKDFDFHNKEHYIQTTQDIRDKLITQLNIDANFFSS